jgi:hypothetical protein
MNKEHDIYIPKDDMDLFDNPMTRAALAAMSDEQKRKYKEIGQEMYGHMNFEDSKVLNNIPHPMEETIAYIQEQLKSGLHPSDLEDNEKSFLTDALGKEWYNKWGYVKEDLTSIFTIKNN